MKKNEFLEELKKINERLSELHRLEGEIKKERQDLKEKRFITAQEEAEHKLGDKVHVVGTGWTGSKENETDCFIGSVKLTDDGTIEYSFNKIKKDGTISQNKIDRWDFRNIKSISPVTL